MWIRLLIVMLGLIVMINGCNSLISQHFGTHKLRVMDATTLQKEGLGDADFIRLEGAQLGEDYLVGPKLNERGKDYHLHPVFTPAMAAAHAAGDVVEPLGIAWFKIPYPDCVKNGDCLPAMEGGLQGLIANPGKKQHPMEAWASKRIRLPKQVIYIQLGEHPLAWYWNLLLFLGGISLALGTESFWQKRKRRLKQKEL